MANVDEPASVRDPNAELKVAAAAVAAAISPPVGVAVAAGAALRSPRVRHSLRRGTVALVAGAMQVSDQLSSATSARRATSGQAQTAPAGQEVHRDGVVRTGSV